MAAEVQSIQGLLWKQKKGVGGSTWKKHWVYADDRNFLQWTGKVRPGKAEQPKYAYSVSTIDIKESDVRKFAFEITSLLNGTSMVYAADDQSSFSKWMKILRRKITKTVTIQVQEDDVNHDHDHESVALRSQTSARSAIRAPSERDRLSLIDTVSKLSERSMDYQLMEEPADPQTLVHHFFQSRVYARDLVKLLGRICPQLHPARVVALFQTDLHLDDDDVVTFTEFTVWWEDHLALLGGEAGQAMVVSPSLLQGPTVLAPTDLRLFGHVPLSHLDTDEVLIEASFIRVPVLYQAAAGPLEDDVSVQAATTHFAKLPSGDWVSTYQNAVAAVYDTSARNDADEYKKAILKLLAVRARFYEVAAMDAHKIVEELVLPARMRTIHQIDGSADSCSLVYSHGGLHYRLVNVPLPADANPLPATHLDDPNSRPSSQPHLPSDHERELVATHDLLHKLQSAEFKANQSVNALYSALHARVALHDKYADDHTHSNEFQEQLSYVQARLPVSGLSTVVDVSHYRVVAYLPLSAHTDIAPVTTLGDGPLIEAMREEGLDGLERGLRGVHHELPSQAFPAALGFELRGQQLLPADLPAHLEHNALTKQMRVEYLHTFAAGGQRHITSTVELLHLCAPPPPPRRAGEVGTVEGEEEAKAHGNIVADELAALQLGDPTQHPQLRQWLGACQHLYVRHLPRLAQMLDDNVISVCDCTSISYALHSHGASLRHMGVLYALCHNEQTKFLLFLNMLARAVKVLVRHTVNAHTHAALAKTRIYEDRGASRDHHFTEHADHVHSIRAKLLVASLNHLLHPAHNPDGELGTEARAFQVNLLDLVYRKYGLYLADAPHALFSRITATTTLSTSAHNIKQLLLFLQAQLGVQFKDEVFALIYVAYSPHVLTADKRAERETRQFMLKRALIPQDLYTHVIARVKVDTSLPTEVGYLLRRVNALNRLRLFGDLCDVMEVLYVYFQAFLNSAMLGYALTPLRANVVLVYLYALYNRHPETCAQSLPQLHRIVHEHLSNPYAQLCTVYTSRIMAFYMHVCYKHGLFEQAHACFDGMLYINTACLPGAHPQYCMPLLTLAQSYAEAYQRDERKAPALLFNTKLMLELALSVLAQHNSYMRHMHVLQLQLALLHMHQRQYHQAVDLLAPMLRVLDDSLSLVLTSSAQPAADLQDYLLVCHSLCMCYYHLRELGLSLMCSEKMLSIRAQVPAVAKEKLGYQLLLSAQFVVYNIYVQRADYDQALEVAQQLYSSVLDSQPLRKFGDSYVLLLQHVAYNIVSLVICTLSSHSKALLESAAKDYDDAVTVQAHLQAFQDHDELQKVANEWHACMCDVSEKVLFSSHTVQYVALLLDALQRRHREDGPALRGANTEPDTRASAASASLRALVDGHDLSLQAACLFRLAQQSDRSVLVDLMTPSATPQVRKEPTKREVQELVL